MSAVPNVVSLRSQQLRSFAVRALQATRADGVAIALWVGNEVICEASIGDAPPVGSKVDRGSTLSASCLRDAKPVSFSRVADATHAAYSAMLVPMFAGGRVIGFFGAFAARAEAFTSGHQRILAAYAQAAAGSVGSANVQPARAPASTAAPAAVQPVPAPAYKAPELDSDVVKDVEAEIAAFAIRQKRRARWALAGKSLCMTVLAVGMAACFFPDRVQSWAQPIADKVQSSIERLSSPTARHSDGAATKPSGAIAYAAGK